MKSTYKPADAKKLFNDININWWVAGGWALDLFLGKQSREHEDLDIAFLRKDERKVRDFLNDWYTQVGLGDGKLEPEAIVANSKLPNDREIIWCKPSKNDAWSFEILFSESEGNEWIFKRDNKIRQPIQEIGGVTNDGIRYLQPEIVLLFKAKSINTKNQNDFETVLRKLDSRQKDWLKKSISIVHPGHPWLNQIS